MTAILTESSSVGVVIEIWDDLERSKHHPSADKRCIFGILYSIVRPLVPLSSSLAGRLLPGSICIRCPGLPKKETFLGVIGKQARHFTAGRNRSEAQIT